MNMFRMAALAAVSLALSGPALADGPDYLSQGREASRVARHSQGSNGVAANGRCNGMSYGTGARSCGTASGGPVGGIGSRN